MRKESEIDRRPPRAEVCTSAYTWVHTQKKLILKGLGNYSRAGKSVTKKNEVGRPILHLKRVPKATGVQWDRIENPEGSLGGFSTGYQVIQGERSLIGVIQACYSEALLAR